MGAESILYTRLSGFAGLIALVSTRIYPLILPQGVTYPAVTYQRISTPPREAAMGADPGIARPRFQVTAWAETYLSAKSVSEQVRVALERYTTTNLFTIFVIAENDLFDDEAEKFGSAIDFEVIHTEAVS